ncbi:MAG: GGDEF domain-containing protein [Clostridia bacterium]|nr:GGDEF domain-containing protein [Clostridia bacterium]
MKNNGELNSVIKLSYRMNTVILMCVLIMMGYFKWFRVKFMFWLSVPYIVMYLSHYVLIRKLHLTAFVWSVYSLMTTYMISATVCMGVSSGFILYCMSLIPIAFYLEYISYRIDFKKVSPLILTSMLLAGSCVSALYSLLCGPVYEIERESSEIMFMVNAVAVLFFLVAYTIYITKSIITSEKSLNRLAITDPLTKCYNRNYMMNHLNSLVEENEAKDCWISLVDIDDFKQINDTYGHNFGDTVLKTIAAKLMSDSDVTVARWGGEEFVLCAKSSKVNSSYMEMVRNAVANHPFEYEGKKVRVTISSGVSDYGSFSNTDAWIKDADMKMYVSKGSGKNQTIY